MTAPFLQSQILAMQHLVLLRAAGEGELMTGMFCFCAGR